MYPYFKHMKKFFAILAAVLALSSCSIIFAPDTSPARQFVGTYTMSVHESGTWGRERIDDDYSAVVQINKADFDRVYISGAFETYGRVEGNRIYIESIKSSDSYGNLTTSFVDCTLNGTVLTMQVRQSGSLLSIHTGEYQKFNSSLTLKGTRD